MEQSKGQAKMSGQDETDNSWENTGNFLSGLIGVISLFTLVIFGWGWLSDVVFGNMTTGQYIQKVKTEWPVTINNVKLKLQEIGNRAANVEPTRQTPTQEISHRVERPFNYVYAVIRSLHWALDAKETISSFSPEGDEPDFSLQAMTNIRVAANKLVSARATLNPFLKSNNKYINKSASGFDTAYNALLLSFDKNLSILEKVANMTNEEGASNIGTISKEASEFAAQADEGWKLLVYAAIASTYALVDNEREEGGGHHYLTITTEEKVMLLKELQDLFGDKIKIGFQAGQHSTFAAPAVLWQFLTEEGWKPSDVNDESDTRNVEETKRRLIEKYSKDTK